MLLLPFQPHEAPADKQAVEEQPDPNQKRNQANQPQAPNNFSLLRVFGSGYGFKKETEKNHHANADQRGNDTAFDFLKALDFGRDAIPPFALFFAQEHFLHPGLAPVKLVSG
ncbi:MAG TPA: hypothetical protein VFD58_23505 [Blastocatellia bacterium]|nr:hypothetical protein [Blastocatellia bacterium]